MRKTEPKPKYAPTDRVRVNGRPGMVLQQVTNYYLLRPGFRYLIELDGGEKIEAAEDEITR